MVAKKRLRHASEGVAGPPVGQTGRMRRDPRSYFRVKSVFTDERLAAIEEGLWTGTESDAYAEEAGRTYRSVVLAQYELYVEMADRASARRTSANTFFLTLNSAIFTLIGVFWDNRPEASEWALAFPTVVLVAQCMTWYWTLRSYRQLSAAKYAVIGKMEERLPAAPYSNAEWRAVGMGTDPELYWPLTHVESVIPLLFAAAYVGGLAAALLGQ